MTNANDITTDSCPDPVDIDCRIRELLAKQHKIAIVWCIEDVQEVRPDLSNEQAWEVLQQVEDIHDAQCGVSWTTLEIVAEDLFPETASTPKEPDHGN